MTKGKVQPVLVLMRGLPGGGKSYIAEKVKQLFSDREVVVVDPDQIDYASPSYQKMCEGLRRQGVDEKFYPYRFVRAQAQAAIEAGKVVIWTQAFTNLDGFQKTVANRTDHAKRHAIELPMLVVEVEVVPEIARQRIKERAEKGGFDVSPERFEKFINEYRSFESEGYSTLHLDGAADGDQNARLLAEHIGSMFYAS